MMGILNDKKVINQCINLAAACEAEHTKPKTVQSTVNLQQKWL